MLPSSAKCFLRTEGECVSLCGAPQGFGASNQSVTAPYTSKDATVPTCGADMHDKHTLWAKAGVTRGQVCLSDNEIEIKYPDTMSVGTPKRLPECSGPSSRPRISNPLHLGVLPHGQHLLQRILRSNFFTSRHLI